MIRFMETKLNIDGFRFNLLTYSVVQKRSVPANGEDAPFFPIADGLLPIDTPDSASTALDKLPVLPDRKETTRFCL